jgi:hypothetical protein
VSRRRSRPSGDPTASRSHDEVVVDDFAFGGPGEIAERGAEPPPRSTRPAKADASGGGRLGDRLAIGGIGVDDGREVVDRSSEDGADRAVGDSGEVGAQGDRGHR